MLLDSRSSSAMPSSGGMQARDSTMQHVKDFVWRIGAGPLTCRFFVLLNIVDAADTNEFS